MKIKLAILLVIFIVNCLEAIGQEDPIEFNHALNADNQINEIHDVREQLRFSFYRFDWIEWNAIGIFPEEVLLAIKERAMRLNGFIHWLELQSIQGMDTLYLSKLLEIHPEILYQSVTIKPQQRETKVASINRLSFPILNRYYDLDSSRIPEGSPWSNRVRLTRVDQHYSLRLTVEKDAGERLFPVDHFSWTFDKKWQLNEWKGNLIIGQFRPFFGIGYRYGLRSGRSASAIGSWAESHDLQIKPLAAPSENVHPYGIAVQAQYRKWTIAGFYSEQQFPLTQIQQIDLIQKEFEFQKPRLAGFHRTQNERIEELGKEKWIMLGGLYQQSNWAAGISIHIEHWSGLVSPKKQWVFGMAYLRKSYSGGHVQTELAANTLGMAGIKVDWIHWIGNKGFLSFKSQSQLANQDYLLFNSLVNWKSSQADDQYWQIQQGWKVGKGTQLFYQLWREWNELEINNQIGQGFGIVWNTSKTDVITAELRNQSGSYTMLFKSVWLYSPTFRIKSTFRINSNNSSYVADFSLNWSPKHFPIRLNLQAAGFQIENGIMPLMEADLEYPYRMNLLSGRGSRIAFNGKYRIPPHFTIGFLGILTSKTGPNPFGSGPDGRSGSILYELAFSIEFRIKDKH